MKKRLVFIIPILILLGFLAFKPPAIGSETKQVVVTPTSTTTSAPIAKPNLRDFGDDGEGPTHRDFDNNGGPGFGQDPSPHLDGDHPDGNFHHDDLGERDDHEQD